MDVPTLLLIAVLGIASGLMIGCVGIGGVILVPALVFLARVPIEVSIPAAMIAYIVSGLVATAIFARNKSIRWSRAGWLCAGAAPTAFAGAWAVSVVSPLLLETGLGLLTLFRDSIRSGRPTRARILRPRRRTKVWCLSER